MSKKFSLLILLCILSVLFFSMTVSAEKKTTKDSEKETAKDDSKETDDTKEDNEMVVINILGDSITEGYALENVTDGYAYQLGNFPGIQVNNYGLSGSAVAGNNVDRFLDRYPDMESGADIILVLGGTNDYKGAGDGSTSLGLPGSQNPLDFYYGYGSMIAGIQKKFPDSQLVLVTPITRDGYQQKNMYGYALKDYAHAIMLMGKAYKVPVIDLFHNKKVDFAGNWDYLSDGLHPTPAGHKLMAQEIYDSLKNLGLVK